VICLAVFRKVGALNKIIFVTFSRFAYVMRTKFVGYFKQEYRAIQQNFQKNMQTLKIHSGPLAAVHGATMDSFWDSVHFVVSLPIPPRNFPQTYTSQRTIFITACGLQLTANGVATRRALGTAHLPPTKVF